MKPLGKIKQTKHGFEKIKFTDMYGDDSSLEASLESDSTVGNDSPGTVAVWLGNDQETAAAIWLGNDHERVHPATEKKLGARMHLNREQVVALVAHLVSWLNSGTFRITTGKPMKRRKGK